MTNFGLEVLTGKALFFLLEFIDKTCEKVFCLPNANGGVHAHSCIMGNQGKIAGNKKICISFQSQLFLPEFIYLMLSRRKK